jgi:hypothetical protein
MVTINPSLGAGGKHATNLILHLWLTALSLGVMLGKERYHRSQPVLTIHEQESTRQASRALT